MAKKKEKEISSVELKNPDMVIHLKNLGLKITVENLTIERYEKLVSLSKDYEQFFNVKLTPKKDETSELETKG